MAESPKSQSGKPSSGPITSRYASDPEMAELIGLFVSDLPTRVQSLRTAWEAQKLRDLERLVHQLRGAGLGYGFAAVSDAAGSVETRLRELGSSSPPPIGTLAAEFERLIDVCSRVRPAA